MSTLADGTHQRETSLAESYQQNDNADSAQVASGLKSLRTTLETRTNALRSEVVAGGT